MTVAMLQSRRATVLSLAIALVAGACRGGGSSGKPDDPCAVGPVEHRPIPIEEPGRRPPVVHASQFRTKWPIKHVIFIVKENRTFDNLFALFPGADGATTGRLNGRTVQLRQCIKQRLPADLIHSYPVALEHWNKGKMDGFGNTGGLARQEAYSVARRSDVPNYWHWAENYVLSDNFFASAMGPSFPNHLMAIAASSGGTHDNPEGPRLPAFRKGWGCDSPKETYVLVEAPDGEITKVPPCFDMLTEGDLLNRADIPWAFYGAERLHLGYIWQAYNAIRHIRESEQWDKRVFDVEQVVNDIRDDRLPPVTWITPIFQHSDHPDANICDGENWTTQVVNAVMESPQWKDTAIFITWDDWGGFYDHVAPKQIDKFGFGFRVPMLVISPYAKRGYLDHEQGEFSSVLRFIEDNWGLTQLTHRDRRANNFAHVFDFSQDPRPPDPIPLRTDCQTAPWRELPRAPRV